jgi:hypothetical protein
MSNGELYVGQELPNLEMSSPTPSSNRESLTISRDELRASLEQGLTLASGP